MTKVNCACRGVVARVALKIQKNKGREKVNGDGGGWNVKRRGGGVALLDRAPGYCGA